MCGFTGFINFVGHDSFRSNNIITEMTNSLIKRGPDDSGVWIREDSAVALGHRRLAILDLTPAGHQPMHSLSDQYVIAFNGEIYNHLEVRNLLDLQKGAHPWKGTSDTETLVEAIDFWGLPKALSLCIGMFAFALWDKKAEKLSLARDRLGEKPLYYGWIKDAFVFGSELKALKAHPNFNNEINRQSLSDYFRFSYVPGPKSIYQNIYKLEPGSFFQESLKTIASQDIEQKKYWNFSEVVSVAAVNKFTDEHEAVELLEGQLKESINMQMLADVPLGAFLSGGVDSSLIVSLMQNESNKSVKTFTVGFEDSGFDESPFAKSVANFLGTDHHELFVTSKETMDAIPLMPYIFDEPFADTSQIPTYLVSKAARKEVTVALSGDAGDELFGGYNRYFWGPRIWSKVSWLPFGVRRLLGKAITSLPVDRWDGFSRSFNNFSSSRNNIANLGDKAHKLGVRLGSVKTIDDLYLSLVSEWDDPASLVRSDISFELASLSKRDNIFNSDLNIKAPAERMMLWDSLTYLPDDILCKVDRAAMANSLETRVPFLDHRIVETAWRFPHAMKIVNNQGKIPLRKILYKYVPQNLIERPKAGFGIPIGDWLRGPLRPWAEKLIDPPRIDREGYLFSSPIQQCWKEHLSGRRDWTMRLWSVLMFQAWLEKQ